MLPECPAASFCTQSSHAVGAELRALRFDRDDLGCYRDHGCKRVPVLVRGVACSIAHGAPITRLLVRKAIIGQDRTGAIVVQAPVDYVSWTQDMSYFANRPDFQGHRKIVSLTGQFSPLARKNFQTLGWMTNEKVNPIPPSQNGP